MLNSKSKPTCSTPNCNKKQKPGGRGYCAACATKRWRDRVRKEKIQCCIDGCTNLAMAPRKMCRKHYDITRKAEGKKIAQCSIEGCPKEAFVKGVCRRHYDHIYLHGKILERTRYDGNEFIDYGEYVGVVLFNKDFEPVAETFVDKEDLDVIKQHKWYLSAGYATTNLGGGKSAKIHQVLFPDNEYTDHKDRNKLNNLKTNLRPCTALQNAGNQSPKITSESEVMGVYQDHSLGDTWVVRIRNNYKNIFLGYYDSFEDAVKVRLQAEIEYRGEFAPQAFAVEFQSYRTDSSLEDLQKRRRTLVHNSKSGVVGVTWDNTKGKFESSISSRRDGKTKKQFLGYYRALDHARLVRAAAELEYQAKTWQLLSEEDWDLLNTNTWQELRDKFHEQEKTQTAA